MGILSPSVTDQCPGRHTDGGVIYGKTFDALEYVTEDWFGRTGALLYPGQME
ncbi:MAG: hypothetical protein ACLTYN_13710 [Dysosmobacter welbionis]